MNMNKVWTKHIWKYRLQNVCQFVPDSIHGHYCTMGISSDSSPCSVHMKWYIVRMNIMKPINGDVRQWKITSFPLFNQIRTSSQLCSNWAYNYKYMYTPSPDIWSHSITSLIGPTAIIGQCQMSLSKIQMYFNGMNKSTPFATHLSFRMRVNLDDTLMASVASKYHTQTPAIPTCLL